jgi:hypothetical protein
MDGAVPTSARPRLRSGVLRVEPFPQTGPVLDGVCLLPGTFLATTVIPDRQFRNLSGESCQEVG